MAVAVTVWWTAAIRAEDDRVVEEPLASQPPAQQQLVDLGANFDANLFELQAGWVLRGDDGGQEFGKIMVNGRRIAPAAAGVFVALTFVILWRLRASRPASKFGSAASASSILAPAVRSASN